MQNVKKDAKTKKGGMMAFHKMLNVDQMPRVGS